MKTRRDQIVSQLHQLQSEVNVMNFLGDDKVMKTMETMRDPKTLSSYLTREFNVSANSINLNIQQLWLKLCLPIITHYLFLKLVFFIIILE